MSKTNIKIFQCSCPIFNGYQCKIDMNYCEYKIDIIKIFKKSLLKILEEQHLHNLCNILNSKISNNDLENNISNRVAINYDIEEILLGKENEIFIIRLD